jgi:hypothetical protein
VGPVLPDSTTSVTISDNNGVGVRFGPNDTGALIDSMAWGMAANDFRNVSSVNPGPGEALVREHFDGSEIIFSVMPSQPRSTAAVVTPEPDPILPTPAEEVETPVPEVDTTSQDLPAEPEIIAVNPEPPQNAQAGLVKMSEILANPQGDDTGNEIVELENVDMVPIDITGWFLDDASSAEVSGPQRTAYQLPHVIIGSNQVLAVVIPKGRFVLNNTGDTVNLYDADKQLVDSVTYNDDGQEGQSYQKIADTYQWLPATLGDKNTSPVNDAMAVTTILFNEVFANPKGSDDGQEWVELLNIGTNQISLKDFWLDDYSNSAELGSNAWQLASAIVIPAGELLWLQIPEDRFSLNNTGQEGIRLFDSQKHLILEQLFSDAPEGRSYARNSDGVWSYGEPTPNAPNNFGQTHVAGVASDQKADSASVASELLQFPVLAHAVSPPSGSPTETVTDTAPAMVTIQTMVATLSAKIDSLTNQLVLAQAQAASAPSTAPVTQRSFPNVISLLGIGGMVVVVFLVLKCIKDPAIHPQ